MNIKAPFKKKIPVITTPEKLFYICSTFKVEP